MNSFPKQLAFALWFTGMSGSGKTTLARGMVKYLQKKTIPIHHIDGDELRGVHKVPLGFTQKDRDKNIEIAVDLARIYQDKGVNVITSFISPYLHHRDIARERLTNFIEVFVDAPLETCEQRDVKGLYKKARAGEIENFTGISDIYEPPTKNFLHIPTNELTIDESLARILNHLKKNRIIS